MVLPSKRSTPEEAIMQQFKGTSSYQQCQLAKQIVRKEIENA